MQGLLTLLAVGVVMGATYLIFRLIGPRRQALLLTREEKARWDATVVPRLGGPLVVASLVGTLTSLATAYLFFIGTSKVFGYWIFICPFSIFAGAFITNAVTKAVMNREELRTRISGTTQQSGVIARLFWSDCDTGRSCSRLVKWISLLSVLGVIWLEFALFSDVLAYILGIENILATAAICGIATYIIALFTLKYGLRGFIFADAFHAPLLALATIILVIATIVRFITGPSSDTNTAINFGELVKPLVSTGQGVLFVIHVLILNSFLVVFTEAHWLRLWALTPSPVIGRQIRGALSTAILWTILPICGLLAYSMTNSVGEKAAIDLVASFGTGSSIVIAVFWLGAGAALFSTADTQLYSALLLRQFNPCSGEVDDTKFDSIRPGLLALYIALIFFFLYAGVRYLALPFEKIIFIIIPFTLNLMPGFVALLTKKQTRVMWILISLIGYLACAMVGFFQPNMQFAATLAASIVPVVVSLVVLILPGSSRDGRK